MTLMPLYVLLGSYFALISWRAAHDRLRPAAAARSASSASLRCCS